MYAHKQDGIMVGSARKEYNHRKPVIGKGEAHPRTGRRGGSCRKSASKGPWLLVIKCDDDDSHMQ